MRFALAGKAISSDFSNSTTGPLGYLFESLFFVRPLRVNARTSKTESLRVWVCRA